MEHRTRDEKGAMNGSAWMRRYATRRGPLLAGARERKEDDFLALAHGGSKLTDQLVWLK
jgi:hypothetical protein